MWNQISHLTLQIILVRFRNAEIALIYAVLFKSSRAFPNMLCLPCNLRISRKLSLFDQVQFILISTALVKCLKNCLVTSQTYRTWWKVCKSIFYREELWGCIMEAPYFVGLYTQKISRSIFNGIRRVGVCMPQSHYSTYHDFEIVPLWMCAFMCNPAFNHRLSWLLWREL